MKLTSLQTAAEAAAAAAAGDPMSIHPRLLLRQEYRQHHRYPYQKH